MLFSRATVMEMKQNSFIRGLKPIYKFNQLGAYLCHRVSHLYYDKYIKTKGNISPRTINIWEIGSVFKAWSSLSLSLPQDTYLNIWEDATMFPIPKRETSSSPLNMLIIILLHSFQTLPKMMETAIDSTLPKHLESRSFFNNL